MFKRSEKSGYQYGKGLYFTDSLDYAWYYGWINNRAKLNTIPKIGEQFNLVSAYIYYNEKGKKRVYNNIYTPKKNKINFAYSNSHTKPIEEVEPDKKKFYGSEYVIYEFS